jgi:hypothetical protein
MHPDLSPHLHSPECNAAIKVLLACHEDVGFWWKFWFCNHPPRFSDEFHDFSIFSQLNFYRTKLEDSLESATK